MGQSSQQESDEEGKTKTDRPKGFGLAWGVGFGLLVAGAMVFFYHQWFAATDLLMAASVEVTEKVASFGVTSPGRYLALSLFYCLCHSGLEEYYWRWFVFARLRQRGRLSTAVIVSSLGFTAHHVILLAAYFGWASPVTYLFAGGVTVGGVVWAILYHRTGSLLSPWLSHLCIDGAIFLIGWQMITQG